VTTDLRAGRANKVHPEEPLEMAGESKSWAKKTSWKIILTTSCISIDEGNNGS
jgi:hypothetical protein